MLDLTTEQRTTLAIIDAADTIARGAIANALALQGAAGALRDVIAPRGGCGGVSFVLCTPIAGCGDGEAQSEADAETPASEPVKAPDASEPAPSSEITIACDTKEALAAVKDCIRELELSGEASTGRQVDEDGALVDVDHAMAELQRLGQDADAAEAPVETPKDAALPDSADASETVSAASPAAPDRDLRTAYGADLDMIAEQFDVKRSHGETDASLRAFLAALAKGHDVTRRAGVWDISASASVETNTSAVG